MAIIMLIFIILPPMSFNKISYASTDINVVLNKWLGEIEDASPNFYHFSYKKETKVYDAYFMKIVLPEENAEYPRIAYKYSASGSISFVLQESETKESPIKLNLYVVQNNTTRSVLKRQVANNFDKYGYLLEVAGNITAYEGQEIKLSATIETENEKYNGEVTILDPAWDVGSNFENIRQGTEEDAWYETLWKWLTDAVNEVKNLLEPLINKVFLAFADGIFSAICAAVGEQVTMDKIIFGKVGKLSINFWKDTAVGVKTNVDATNSVMSVMKDVVNNWYSVLFTIAVLVYLIALLVVGIKIVFSSTGDAKAKYKDVFQAWITGVMILCLFPYVMKYTLKLNNLLVEMINQDLQMNNALLENTPAIDETKLDNASDSFGEDNFISSIAGSSFEPSSENARRDMMLYIRDLAGNLGKMSLTFVYFVMLGELLVIIFVYYKRVFMMAFLITIFPVIAIMYIVEKLISGSSRAFSTWLKEYIILVFTQAFHAAVYVVVVNAGVKVYIEEENWLFMLMCVIFLFQGEKILRSIFGMKSSANTISDLAAAGVAGYAVAKSAQRFFKKDKSQEPEQDKLEQAEKKLEQNKIQTQNSSNATNNDRTNNSQTTQTNNNSQNNEEQQSRPQDITNDSNSDFLKAQSVVMEKALKQRQETRKGKGATGKIGKALQFVGNTTERTLKIAGGAAGATLGLAAGLAQGKVSNAVAYAAGGMAVGKKISGIVKTPIRGINNAYKGRKLKKQIMSGELDNEFKEAGLDMQSLDTVTQKMFRKALAGIGSRTTRLGQISGELKTVNKMKKINKKNK